MSIVEPLRKKKRRRERRRRRNKERKKGAISQVMTQRFVSC
jgi:hypothetical protein